jgi:hypothetical protein
VLLRIDKSRGSQVLIEVLGKEFEGTLGCDYFSAYRKFMNDFDVAVQFCIAHLLRDIRFLVSLPDASTRAYGDMSVCTPNFANTKRHAPASAQRRYGAPDGRPPPPTTRGQVLTRAWTWPLRPGAPRMILLTRERCSPK